MAIDLSGRASYRCSQLEQGMSASVAGSASAASDLPGPLSSLPLRSFIDFLNARHALALTDKEAERSAQVLQEQWFSVAEGRLHTHGHTLPCTRRDEPTRTNERTDPPTSSRSPRSTVTARRTHSLSLCTIVLPLCCLLCHLLLPV